MREPWKLSPSDLTFLWDECPRCFYLKVVKNINRPSAPFPKIFSRIDKLMKDYYGGRRTSEISLALPDGVIKFGEKWVKSHEISLPNRTSTCYLRGKFDTVIEFADSTFGIVDFKTSEPRPEHVDFYSRQLHAYAAALENPAPGSFSLAPITRLGLLCVEPVNMAMTPNGQIAYIGDVAWLECPRDDAQFFEFLDRILTVLECPSPPEPGKDCGYCRYREAARGHGL